MVRTLGMGLILALLAGGCASNSGLPRRTVPKVILGALVLGGAALAVSAAIKSDGIEKDLREDYARGGLSGRDFADRDAEGERWNRIGRASAFVSGLSLLGLGILWEMSLSDRAGRDAVEAPANAGPPIFPLSPPAALALPPLPAQMSTAAR